MNGSFIEKRLNHVEKIAALATLRESISKLISEKCIFLRESVDHEINIFIKLKLYF